MPSLNITLRICNAQALSRERGKKKQQLHFGAKLGAYPSFTNKCRRIERQQLGQACSESRGEEGHPSPARLRAGFPCAPPEQALLEVLLV